MSDDEQLHGPLRARYEDSESQRARLRERVHHREVAAWRPAVYGNDRTRAEARWRLSEALRDRIAGRTTPDAGRTTPDAD